MATRTAYAYAQGMLEPLDREYFKNTLRFLPGVAGVGAIGTPSLPAPAGASLGYEVRFDPAKVSVEEIQKRLIERGFRVAAVQDAGADTAPAKVTATPVQDIYSPVAPNGTKEVLFRVEGLVTILDVRRIREALDGTPGILGFFSMVSEAADEPWAGDTGLVDVQYDAARLTEHQLKDLIERVQGLKVTTWKFLPNNLNFPFPL